VQAISSAPGQGIAQSSSDVGSSDSEASMESSDDEIERVESAKKKKMGKNDSSAAIDKSNVVFGRVASLEAVFEGLQKKSESWYTPFAPGVEKGLATLQELKLELTAIIQG
ncbi:unnamed protein product, partial [Prorocentrum cordatum]